MSKGKKNAVIIMSIAVLLLVSVAVGTLLGGTDKLMAFIGKHPETTEQTDEDDGAAVSVCARPANMKAVYLDSDKIELSASDDVDTNITRLEKVIADIADKGFDTVFVSVPENRFPCSNGSVDMLSVLLEKAKDKGLYTCIAINASEVSSETFADLGAYSFDCVALLGNMSTESKKQAVSTLRTANKNVSAALAADAENAAECAAALDSRYSDFLISLPADKTSAGENYISSLEKVNDAARQNGLDFAAAIRVDLLGDGGAAAAQLITEQLDACETLDSCSGSIMYDYSFFTDDSPVGTLVLKYMSDKNREELEKDFELKNFDGTSKTVSESKLTFTGSSSPLSELTLNGKPVDREANGDFSFEVSLKVGKNEFEFSHKDKTYTYTVVYEIKILESVTPSESMEAPGGSSVKVTAVALKGADVTATLGGMKIKLQQLSNVVQDENGSMLNENSDFAVYSGRFTLPASTSKVQSLGRIKVYANFNGISATMSGSNVSVSAVIPVPEPEPAKPEETEENTTESPTDKPSDTTGGSTGESFDPSKMLTPYAYAGVSGKSKMCEITALCETMPGNVIDDYVPYSSPLPAGTFDYIKSEYTYGGNKYYKLGSGKNVLASKTKVIESGYNLPQNRVTVVSSESNSEATTIKFGLLWKCPFNIGIKNQSYIPQSQANGGSLYAVSSFNGKYLDVTFYHTVNVSGKANVTGSRIVSAAEWISDTSANTLTLRLTLKTPGKFYGYCVNYTSDGCLTLSVKAKPATSLSGSVIMIDAGHGGNDSGAICAYNPDSSKKYEKQINLSIAQKIKTKLEARGATVIMTRSSDVYLSLDDRVAAARRQNPDMFISVHCDSSESATPMGTTAYYYQAYSFPLASSIHNRIVTAYKNNIYAGADSSKLSKVDRGTNMYPFRVTRIEECPAVLIEYGFVSNISECKVLWSNSVQDSLAQATVDGIADYISAN